jgi:hypothetical protein
MATVMHLLGLWHLDETTHTLVLTDSSGRNNHLTLAKGSGAALKYADEMTVPGFLNTALDFSGVVNTYAYISSIPIIGSAFRVIGYVKFTTSPDPSILECSRRAIFQRATPGGASAIELRPKWCKITQGTSHSTQIDNDSWTDMVTGVWYKFELVFDRYASGDTGDKRIRYYMNDVLLGESDGYDENITDQGEAVLVAGINDFSGAIFDEVEFWASTTTSVTLDASDDGNGSVTLPTEQITSHEEGDIVPIQATPAEGYEFYAWVGDTVANPAAASTTITMDGNKTIVATFRALVTEVTLTVSTGLGGFVSDPGLGEFTYDTGDVVPIVAEADPGYVFAFWSGTGINQIANPLASSTTITVNADYTLRANFVLMDESIRSPDMINKIDPSRDVPITVSMGQTARALDMTLMALLVPSASFVDADRVKYYTSIDAIIEDYATSTTTYQAGLAFFSQSPRPQKMAIGLIATADQPGKIISGVVSAANLVSLEALGTCVLTIPIAGSPVAITAIALDGITTLANLCSAIAAGSGFPSGGTCTANADGSFTISTGTADGDAQTMGYATAIAGNDISALAHLTAATGASLSQGHTFGDLVTEAEIVRQTSINNGYPIFGWCLDSSYRADGTDDEAFAAWVAALKLGFTILCSNAVGTYASSETATIAYNVNEETANKKAAVVFSDSDSQYPDVSIMARMLAVDYSGTNTAITAFGKDLPGMTPVDLTETQLDILLGKRANCLTLMSNSLRMFRQGTTGNANWYIDDAINIDNLVNELETEMHSVFTRNGKVPYTPAGQSMRRSAASKILQKYVTNGVLAPRPIQDLTNESGFTTLPAYSIKQLGVEAATSAMRAARQDLVMQIEVYLANAIHYGAVTINLVQ